MLKISKLADYATLIMSALGQSQPEQLSAAQVAELTHIPLPTASKLLKMLNEAGLVSSTRGAAGGYLLRRLPAEINIAEIIMAIDGEVAMTECSLGKDICALDQVCGMRGNWQFINYKILEMLKGISLAEMSQSFSTHG